MVGTIILWQEGCTNATDCSDYFCGSGPGVVYCDIGAGQQQGQCRPPVLPSDSDSKDGSCIHFGRKGREGYPRPTCTDDSECCPAQKCEKLTQRTQPFESVGNFYCERLDDDAAYELGQRNAFCPSTTLPGAPGAPVATTDSMGLANPEMDSNDNDAASLGAWIGIAIGTLSIVIIVGVVVIYALYFRRKRQRAVEQEKPEPEIAIATMTSSNYTSVTYVKAERVQSPYSNSVQMTMAPGFSGVKVSSHSVGKKVVAIQQDSGDLARDIYKETSSSTPNSPKQQPTFATESLKGNGGAKEYGIHPNGNSSGDLDPIYKDTNSNKTVLLVDGQPYMVESGVGVDKKSVKAISSLCDDGKMRPQSILYAQIHEMGEGEGPSTSGGYLVVDEQMDDLKRMRRQQSSDVGIRRKQSQDFVAYDDDDDCCFDIPMAESPSLESLGSSSSRARLHHHQVARVQQLPNARSRSTPELGAAVIGAVKRPTDTSIYYDDFVDPIVLLQELGIGDYIPAVAAADMLSADLILDLNDHELDMLGLPLGAKKRFRKALPVWYQRMEAKFPQLMRR